jgi:ribosomal protein L40E
LRVEVIYSGGDPYMTDYKTINNDYSEPVTVLSKPDLQIFEVVMPAADPLENATFSIGITINNTGMAPANTFNISVYHHNIHPLNLTCLLTNITVQGLSAHSDTMQCSGIPGSGTVELHVFVDSENVVNESNEDNNVLTVDVDIERAGGQIELYRPLPSAELTAGKSLFVEGWANSTDPPFPPLAGIPITVTLMDSTGTPLDTKAGNTLPAGYFGIEIAIPEDASSGSDYRICASTSFGNVPDECITVSIKGTDEVFPWWILIIIIIIIIIIIVAAVVYLRYRGLGKMVECGECGALIPEGSTKCPKCGVEFEMDTVKCSSCGAWIPPDVKNCPDCGGEFVVGEVKAEDYQARMKRQYNELVDKFRAKAKKDLGGTFTEDQFLGWWRGQPTYISFQQWLREEEEKKKMGSAPCPICGTLNSVTAKICHRCGTPLKKVEETKAGRPPAEPPAAESAPIGPPTRGPPAAPPQTPSAGPPAAEPRPATPVPKKVVRKPVVQKKVVVKKPGEPEQEQ